MPASTDNLAPIGWYTARDVARLAGVSPRRIGQWARHGIILPSVSRRPNVYSYADAGEAILAHYLIDEGKTPRDVRLIVHKLRDEYGPWPLANAPLEHDGRLVVVRRGDDVFIAVEHDEQAVMGGTLLNLRRIRDALKQGGWVAIEHPHPHIEVDPDRHSGEPVIRGRRIPTWRVAGLAEQPDGRATLREDYELTDEEIDDAVEYERERAALAA